ncbi:MAG TPA: hypothetical protein VEZ72_10390, partial [Paenibacillus sp.]|nr:hypothetical protein [Paenibacillus sp.]
QKVLRGGANGRRCVRDGEHGRGKCTAMVQFLHRHDAEVLQSGANEHNKRKRSKKVKTIVKEC